MCVCVCVLDAAAMKRICGYNSARGRYAAHYVRFDRVPRRTNPCRISDINLPALLYYTRIFATRTFRRCYIMAFVSFFSCNGSNRM